MTSATATLCFPECCSRPSPNVMANQNIQTFEHLKAITSPHNGDNVGYLGILMDCAIHQAQHEGACMPPLHSDNYQVRLNATAITQGFKKGKALLKIKKQNTKLFYESYFQLFPHKVHQNHHFYAK